MTPRDLLIFPPVYLPPCLTFIIPFLPTTLGTCLSQLHRRVPIAQPRPIPFPSLSQDRGIARLREMQWEMGQAHHVFVRGYHRLQEARMGALAALIPDSQMLVEWLELECHFRHEVATYAGFLARATSPTTVADVATGWTAYMSLAPSLLDMGTQMCAKPPAVPASEEGTGAEDIAHHRWPDAPAWQWACQTSTTA